MKFFISFAVIALAAFAAAVTDEQRALAKQHVEKCVTDHGITKEDVQKLKTGDFTDGDSSEKVQCFAFCFFQATKFMSPDGVFDEGVAVEKLSKGSAEPEKVKQVVNQCKGEKGANNCETAYKIYKCAYLARAKILEL